MGLTTLNVDVEIEIDDHLEEATDGAIKEEYIDRFGVNTFIDDVELDEALDIVYSKLTITEADRVRDFFKTVNT